MPHQLGIGGNEDGVVGSTASGEKSGVFGRNDSVSQPPSGHPGGNGVFGLTAVPGKSGVFGAHNGMREGKGFGVFGLSQGGDAVFGVTKTSNANGVVGLNDGTSLAEDGKPVGAGVFGFTTVPNGAGVLGAHRLPGGRGVVATSEQGDGLWAVSHTAGGNGLFAVNDGPGSAPSGQPVGNGAYALSKVRNGSGVFGVNDAGGFGVYGLSQQGVGVRGQGGMLAGEFIGNVTISGWLRVGTIDLQDLSLRLDSLINQVNQLRAEVDQLRSSVGGGSPTPSPSQPAGLSVAGTRDSSSNNYLVKIDGRNFIPQQLCSLYYRKTSEQYSSRRYIDNVAADSSGVFTLSKTFVVTAGTDYFIECLKAGTDDLIATTTWTPS